MFKNMLFYPCITDRTKTSVEFGINKEKIRPMTEIIEILKTLKNVEKLYFSPETGAIVFDYEGKEIIILDSGLVKIKRGLNKKELLETIEKFSRIIMK